MKEVAEIDRVNDRLGKAGDTLASKVTKGSQQAHAWLQYFVITHDV